MTPIGIIHSCFKEKFGIPRQPGLVPEARATLELYSPYGCPEAVAGLEGFSHLWVIFQFHQAIRKSADATSVTAATGWQPSVRPPRLGGNQKMGVFASRSPFRPNGIGLSVVRLEAIDCDATSCQLTLSGIDLLDQTPVLDIKPYVPYTDALPDARAGFASAAPDAQLKVLFSPLASEQCASYAERYPELPILIEKLLSHDPRPAYQAARDEGPVSDEADRVFGMRLYDFDLRWQVQAGTVIVVELVPSDSA